MDYYIERAIFWRILIRKRLEEMKSEEDSCVHESATILLSIFFSFSRLRKRYTKRFRLYYSLTDVEPLLNSARNLTIFTISLYHPFVSSR